MCINNIKHILRYGIHSEQKYFKEFSKSYQVAAINGNIMAHASQAISKFLSEGIVSKEFFIDPLTHAFQHKPQLLTSKKKDKNGNYIKTLKKSIAKMVEIIGEPLKTKAGFKPIIPSDFANKNVRKSFCRNVISFQIETLCNDSNSEDYREYLEFANIKYGKPAIVIAPYFYMSPKTMESWCSLNLEMIKDSVDEMRKIDDEIPVWGQLVVHKEIIRNNILREKIIDSYSSAECKGICLWIDDCNEHEIDSDLLIGIKQLIEAFSNKDILVWNMYGGYYSILLTRFSKLRSMPWNGIWRKSPCNSCWWWITNC